MKKTFLVVSFCSGFLFACNNSGDSSNSSSEIAVDSSMQSTGTAGSDAAFPATTTSNIQALPDSMTEGTIQTISTQPTGATAPGMNPPHGQPGHNCDIAVGAPLNSAPAAKPSAKVEPGGATLTPISTPVNPQLNIPAPTPSGATPTKTAPGMNPPHGEPGHDCGIAVGAPLKK